jgi:ribonuclease E
MSESPKGEQDRWRELHDLLGLPPERGESAPRPAAAARHEPEPLPKLTEVVRDEPARREPVEIDSGAERPELAIVNDEAIAPPLGDEDIPPPLDDEDRPPPPRSERDDDDRPRRGRRRGRRGRRSRGRDEGGREEGRGDDRERSDRGRDDRGRDERARPEPLDTDDTEVEPADDAQSAPASRPGREEEEPSRRRRGRGRGRGRRDERELAEEPAGDEEVASQKPPVEEDDDDEPIETFADWNVPSWPEIVASLYRPDR